MKIYSMQHHSLLSRLSINAHVCLFLSSLIMSERLLCTSCFFPLSLPSLFFFFISVSPFLSMPHLSCSLSPFSPLFSLSSMLKPLLAFFRASYSRHSWDSSWTTERRQTVLLLGCQSFSLLSLLLLWTSRSAPFHLELDIILASLIVFFVPCHALCVSV